MRTVITLLFLSVALSGCNTVNGIGKDIEHAGSMIQKQANLHGDSQSISYE